MKKCEDRPSANNTAGREVTALPRNLKRSVDPEKLKVIEGLTLTW